MLLLYMLFQKRSEIGCARYISYIILIYIKYINIFTYMYDTYFPFPKQCPRNIHTTVCPELRNVNSFTRSKTLEQNFTPRKAHISQQFWDLSETKLTKMIVLDNKC